MIKFERDIRIKHTVDVFIAGGGPAGVAAAVTAARCGLSVYLAEKNQCFGGMGTSAMIPAFMRFSDGINFLSGGIGREIFNKLYGENADYTIEQFSIDTELLKKIYDEMMCQCGAEFSFESNIIDVICSEDGNISYAVIKGKEELFAVSARWFIDATGDGFLSIKAGADFCKGDEDGHMMPGTLCSFWGDIDWDRAVVDFGKDPDARYLHQAFENKIFTINDHSLPGMWRMSSHYGGGNIGHAFDVDGTDEESITKSIIGIRKRISEYEVYYNKYVPGYEKAKLLKTADTLGIRETRRIVCEYMARNEDYFEYAVFDDEIGRYCYPMDVHSYNADGSDAPVSGIYNNGYPKGKSYGISYRSILPKKTKNLLVAGRCIGAQRLISGSLRVMPCCYITGMAAGAAVVQAKEENCDIRSIDIAKMQFRLKNMGAFLPNVHN